MNLSNMELFAVAAVIMAVWMCGVTSINRLLWGLALQTTMIAVIAALHGIEYQAPKYLIFAGVILVIKAIAAPVFLSWVADKIEVKRDKGVGIGSALALFAGCGALALGYFVAPKITQGNAGAGAAGMAIALILIGMLFMLIKKLAVSQVIGFLTLENGITLYALTQTRGMPLMVEMGIIFDVLVGVMLAGLVIFRLNRSFEHIDVTKFKGLKY